MKAELEIKAFALRALKETGGQPLPDSTLRASIRLAFPHLSITEGDLSDVLGGLDSAGLITGLTNDFTRKLVWVLTDKGALQLRQLP
jgi:hypothetical protein